MKTILLPTDFSNNALMAADFAVSKLLGGPAKLILTHIYDIPRGGTSGLFYLMEELQKQAETDIAEFKTTLEKRYDQAALQIDVRLSQGDFAERCNQIANELEVDCIVMGTKGSSGIKEVLIGSNTISLMKRLTKPLYVIPENVKELEIEEIVLSFDGNAINQSVKQEINTFLGLHDLPLRLLHVRINDDNPIQDWSETKEAFNATDLSLHEAHGETFEEGLKQGIQDAKALLVMIKRKQSFWERFFNQSDSQKAVMQTELPILVVPE